MSTPDMKPSADDALEAAVERVAKAMAAHSGWDSWDTAKTCQHTPNGNEPEEERDYWREMARIARAEFLPAI